MKEQIQESHQGIILVLTITGNRWVSY